MSEYYITANRILQNLPETTAQNIKKNNSNASDFAKQDAVFALQAIARILPLNAWPWYIISGTFLGHHREGSFLNHDYDIDLGINAEDINIKALLQLLQQQTAFTIQKIDNNIEVMRTTSGQRHLDIKVSIIKMIHSNGIPIDLFIHYTENGSCWHGSVLHRWDNTPFKLIKTTFEGITVNIPDDADRYLSENYGDWKTPVTEFDSTTGTPNLTIAKNFKSIALFLKRLEYYSAYDSQQADKLRNTLLNKNVLNYNVSEDGSMQLSLEYKL